MKTQPSRAIENGLIAQLTNRVTPTPRQCSRTRCNAAKSILSSMGTIMSQIRTATGRLMLATSSRPKKWKVPGNIWPSPMPAAMHRKTQRVR